MVLPSFVSLGLLFRLEDKSLDIAVQLRRYMCAVE